MHKLNDNFDPAVSCRGRTRLRCPSSWTNRRRGALLVEMLVGTILLGVFLAGIGPMIAWVRTAQDATENHRLATLELANQMERIAALPAEQRTTEQLQQLELSTETAMELSDAELTVVSQSSEAFPKQRQIRLSLTWTDGHNQRVRPLQLAAWLSQPQTEPATTDP